MKIEYDEKGKYFSNQVLKESVQVKIRVFSNQIEGEIHVQTECRLKDELDRDEPFLAVTNAIVYSNDDQELFRTDFIAVRREQIIWVVEKNNVTKANQP